MRAYLHGTAPRAAHTVAAAGDDETTRVSVAASRSDMTAAASEPSRKPFRQVIIPVPEETWVDRKQVGGGGKKWVVAALLAALVTFPVALYLFFYGSSTNSVTQTDRPAANSSPRPSPRRRRTPTTGRRRGHAVRRPDELAARERLEQKKTSLTTKPHSQGRGGGDTGAVDFILAAGMSPDAKDEAGRTVLISAASRGRITSVRSCWAGGPT